MSRPPSIRIRTPCGSPWARVSNTNRLTAAIEARIAATRTVLDLVLDGADGAGISWLHRNAEVLTKEVRDDGRVAMSVRVDPSKVAIVKAKFGA